MVNGLFFYSKILAKLHILFKTCKFFDKKLKYGSVVRILVRIPYSKAICLCNTSHIDI